MKLRQKSRLRLWLFWLFGSVSLQLFSLPIYAGDAANVRVLGFSPNREYFAFEQFGVQDGSGFPYSEIFILDTNSDAWVAGSPVRVLIKDETKTIDEARDSSAQQAAGLLSRLKISIPPVILVSNPLTEISFNDSVIRFTLRPNMQGNRQYGIYHLILKQTKLENSVCGKFGVTPSIIDLSLYGPGELAKSGLQLLKDTQLPKSRGCPLDYRVSEVLISPETDEKTRTLVVLLSVFSLGFEGADRRFIAITRRFEPEW